MLCAKSTFFSLSGQVLEQKKRSESLVWVSAPQRRNPFLLSVFPILRLALRGAWCLDEIALGVASCAPLRPCTCLVPCLLPDTSSIWAPCNRKSLRGAWCLDEIALGVASCAPLRPCTCLVPCLLPDTSSFWAPCNRKSGLGPFLIEQLLPSFSSFYPPRKASANNFLQVAGLIGRDWKTGNISKVWKFNRGQNLEKNGKYGRQKIAREKMRKFRQKVLG